MDLSKLPKLSKNVEAQPPGGSPEEGEIPTAAKVPEARGAVPYMGLVEVWISIGVGAFLLLIQPRLLQWLSSRIFHTGFNEFRDPDTNNIVPYQTVPQFWSDLGVTLLGVVFIIDGLLMFTRRRGLFWAAFTLTVLSTGYNLVYVLASYSSQGFAPISFLGVIFGGYMASTQWRALRIKRPAINAT